MAFRVLVACIAAAASTAVNCTIDDTQAGRRQIWVPNCKGLGCLANGVDESCAWCVYDPRRCVAAATTRRSREACHELDAHRWRRHGGCLEVERGSFEVEGYRCSGNETLLFTPTGKGPFPVVIYMHGMGDAAQPFATGIDGRSDDMAQMAASGLMVLAPNTGGLHSGKYCSSSYVWKDMVLALSTSYAGGADLHPALARASWDRVGVWGFSMGGKTVPRAAAQPGLGIRAMVAEHGARRSAAVTVPSLYLTSSLDYSSSPPSLMQDEFDANQAQCKILGSLEGAQHIEPLTSGSQNVWIARFFACHLARSSSACHDLYSRSRDSYCRAGGEFSNCTVVANHSVCYGDDDDDDDDDHDGHDDDHDDHDGHHAVV